MADGADSLSGGRDRDSIEGEADGDTIDGGPGKDRLIAGTGDDWWRGDEGRSPGRDGRQRRAERCPGRDSITYFLARRSCARAIWRDTARAVKASTSSCGSSRSRVAVRRRPDRLAAANAIDGGNGSYVVDGRWRGRSPDRWPRGRPPPRSRGERPDRRLLGVAHRASTRTPGATPRRGVATIDSTLSTRWAATTRSRRSGCASASRRGRRASSCGP